MEGGLDVAVDEDLFNLLLSAMSLAICTKYFEKEYEFDSEIECSEPSPTPGRIV